MGTQMYSLVLLSSLLLVTPHPTLARDAQTVAEASNKFALDLYRKLVLSATEENILFSPIGVSAALSLALLGMQGKAAENVRKILHFNELDEQAVQGEHKAFRTIFKILESTLSGANAVSAVNKLFLDDIYKPRSQYEEDSLKFYSSVPESVEFKREQAARKRINQWLRDELGSDVKQDLWHPSIVQAEKVLAVLANAMALKGTWQHKFKEGLTRKFEFHRGPGDVIDTSIMIQHGCKYRVSFDATLKAQVAELPFGDNRMTMVVIVPNQIDGLSEVEAMLDYESFARARQHMKEVDTDVFFPKFKIEQSWNLKDALWSLGLRSLFIPGSAEMGLLSEDTSLAISLLLQTAVLEVDEQGRLGPYPVVQLPDKLVVNRPFFFFVEDHKSGAIVFMGRVRKPAGPPGTRHDEL